MKCKVDDKCVITFLYDMESLFDLFGIILDPT